MEEDTKTRDTIMVVVATITETTMEVDTKEETTEVVVVTVAEVADVAVVVITTEITMTVIKVEEILVVIGILAAIEIMIMSNKNQDLYQEDNLSKNSNLRRFLTMVKTNNNLKNDSFKGNKVKITNETTSSKTTVTISMIITEAETTTTETIAIIMEEAKVEEIKFMSVTWTMIQTKMT